MKYFSEEHEWVELHEGVATVGISAFAAEELGDVTFVELPDVGTGFSQGQSMLVIESVKAASDVFAPVSGRVASVNTVLTDRPELVNESPEEEGWLVRLEDVDESELENLMGPEDYATFAQKDD